MKGRTLKLHKLQKTIKNKSCDNMLSEMMGAVKIRTNFNETTVILKLL